MLYFTNKINNIKKMKMKLVFFNNINNLNNKTFFSI